MLVYAQAREMIVTGPGEVKFFRLRRFLELLKEYSMTQRPKIGTINGSKEHQYHGELKGAYMHNDAVPGGRRMPAI